MSRKNFISLILGVMFALSMCMSMIPEWNAFTHGIIVVVIGAVILPIMVMVLRKMEGKTVGTIALDVAGALVPGVGCAWSLFGRCLFPAPLLA